MGRVRSVALSVAGLLLVALSGDCARAEVRVQGPPDDVLIEAEGASVAQILAVLGDRYAVRYRGAPAGGAVSVTFEGPLRRVLVRVLRGNDFVIKGGGDGLDAILLSLQPPAAPSPVVAAALVPRPALRVQGSADDVLVEANGTTVADILAALRARYAVRWRGAPASSPVTATFGGPLRRVLVRMLKGNDFVIKGGGDGLEVILLTAGLPAPTTSAMPAVMIRR